MTNLDIYKDISQRTQGSIMLGVVGPVRTGKSTFIKRFMEQLVIPNIDDIYSKERAKDELPQSGSGKTIMTSEPKFIPEEPVQIRLSDDIMFSVRLIDCVGYMVNGAAGQFEDGSERMVITPWFDHEITMTQAAEEGTSKVISEHSTIGLVITTDGSICDIPREDYTEPEERVINGLKGIGKPFVLILNSRTPSEPETRELAAKLSVKYGVPCIPLSCMELNEDDINSVLRRVLFEFPVSEIAISLPTWVDALPTDSELKQSIYKMLLGEIDSLSKIQDIYSLTEKMNECEFVEEAEVKSSDLGSGTVSINLSVPRRLYYELISSETGMQIDNDGQLIRLLKDMSKIKAEYEHIEKALVDVREKGYGVVLPTSDELEIEDPQIVKQGGKYTVKLKAKAPAIHLLRTGVETELTPSIGGEGASEEIISFLLQGYDGDMTKLWESNIFGKPLYDIAQEGIEERISNLPENARAKLQEALQRVVNEGRGTLICILL